MEERISSVYNDYRKGRSNRRDFIRKLTMITGSTAAAMALLPVLEDNLAIAADEIGRASCRERV